MWIGVISDTGGRLNPRALDLFQGVDYIIHCGGIGAPEVLEALSYVAPVAGVVGQQDSDHNYPFERTLFRKWFEVGIYTTHRIGDPRALPRQIKKELDEHDPQVVLFGHASEPFNARLEGKLFFCPGQAGGRRTKFPKSVGILELEGHAARGEVIPLDEP